MKIEVRKMECWKNGKLGMRVKMRVVWILMFNEDGMPVSMFAGRFEDN